MKYEPEHIEWEAARKVSIFARRELGLEPKDAYAEMRRAVLRVWLLRALSPVGRLIVHSEKGASVVQEFCGLAHAECAVQLNGLVSRIAGCSVRRSFVEIDAQTEDVCLTFVLDAPAVLSSDARGVARSLNAIFRKE